jgi:hypothetical protein
MNEKMTEEEFIKAYCIWCDIEDYNDAQWGKNCYAFERCFKRWGDKNETINNCAKRP